VDRRAQWFQLKPETRIQKSNRNAAREFTLIDVRRDEVATADEIAKNWRCDMAPTTRKQQIDDSQPSVRPSAACITQETINRDLEDLDILATSCDERRLRPKCQGTVRR
jgi:hypothetical protein